MRECLGAWDNDRRSAFQSFVLIERKLNDEWLCSHVAPLSIFEREHS